MLGLISILSLGLLSFTAQGEVVQRDLQSTILASQLLSDQNGCDFNFDNLVLLTEDIDGFTRRYTLEASFEVNQNNESNTTCQAVPPPGFPVEDPPATLVSISQFIIDISTAQINPNLASGIGQVLPSIVDIVSDLSQCGFGNPNSVVAVSSFNVNVSFGLTAQLCGQLVGLAATIEEFVENNVFVDAFVQVRLPFIPIETAIGIGTAAALEEITQASATYEPVNQDTLDATLERIRGSVERAPVVVGIQEQVEILQQTFEAFEEQGPAALGSLVTVIPNAYFLITGGDFNEEVLSAVDFGSFALGATGVFINGFDPVALVDVIIDLLNNLIFLDFTVDAQTQQLITTIGAIVDGALETGDFLGGLLLVPQLPQALGILQAVGRPDIAAVYPDFINALIRFQTDRNETALLLDPAVITVLPVAPQILVLLGNLDTFNQGNMTNPLDDPQAIFQMLSGDLFSTIGLIIEIITDPAAFFASLGMGMGDIGMDNSTDMGMDNSTDMGMDNSTDMGMGNETGVSAFGPFTVGGVFFETENIFLGAALDLGILSNETSIFEAPAILAQLTLPEFLGLLQRTQNQIAIGLTLFVFTEIAGLDPESPQFQFITVEQVLSGLLTRLDGTDFSEGFSLSIGLEEISRLGPLLGLFLGDIAPLIDFTGPIVINGLTGDFDPLVITAFNLDVEVNVSDFVRIGGAFVLPTIDISSEFSTTLTSLGQIVTISSVFGYSLTQALLLFVDYATLGDFGFGSWTNLFATGPVFTDLATCALSTVALSGNAQTSFSSLDNTVAFSSVPIGGGMFAPQITEGAIELAVQEFVTLYSPVVPIFFEQFPRLVTVGLLFFSPEGLAVCAENPFVAPPTDPPSDDDDDDEGDEEDEVPIEVVVPVAAGGVLVAAGVGYFAFAGGAVATGAGAGAAVVGAGAAGAGAAGAGAAAGGAEASGAAAEKIAAEEAAKEAAKAEV